ncbi:MAG: hypothetical protein HY903_05780 [Deltaproteobacteria bacterium]|nr:hypothetical protein [Deltaproteobacteria bacterium]
MQPDVKFVKVLVAAAAILIVFLVMYAWYGVRYLALRAFAPARINRARRPRRTVLAHSQPVVLPPLHPHDFHPEKAAA